MKHVTILSLAVGLTAAACGGSTPSTPSDNPQPGNTTSTTTYTMSLKPSNERPNPVSNAEASATGNATIVLRVTRDPANAIVGATADFQVTMQGFPAGSTITMAHIHPGGALTTGGILVNTGLTSGEAALSGGAASFQKNGINVAADVAQGILNAPGNYYFNVHSAMNPPGVLRAQLDGTGAPEDPTQKPPANPDDPYYPVPTRAR
jgi:hypothetical protein